jgi:hypothetical protein
LANVFARIDGLLGRLVFRAIGCATALITLAAGCAAFGSTMPWERSQSLAALLMFVAGAVIAGCATRWCFSRERTFGEFIEAIEGDDTDNPVSRATQASGRSRVGVALTRGQRSE